jgi:hypothetical protein
MRPHGYSGRPDIRASLLRGEPACRAILTENQVELQVASSLSSREREVLVDGGLLAHLRSGGQPFSINLGHSAAVDQGSPVTSPLAEDDGEGGQAYPR